MSVRTFEYKIVSFSNESHTHFKRGILEEVLKEEGENGWELVVVERSDGSMTLSPSTQCIFKRQL